MSEVLVLYYSKAGSTEKLARQVCRGVDSADGMASRLRTVPPVSATTEASDDEIPQDGPPYVTMQDLAECSGLVMGSPTRFGNMDASLKYFIDSTVSEWMSAVAVGKALPLIHHGMIYVGIPWTEPEMSTTTTGGTPYGASHVSWSREHELSDDEKALAQALGKRVAEIARQLT